ncbi:hypothetical protein QVA66_08810 [Staphylococcus chromogenes]|nr:hypothetical protein [Staphylococcus chromogenes]
MAREIGDPDPLPAKYLPVFLAVFGALFLLVPVLFFGVIYVNTHPGQIPFLHGDQKELAAQLDADVAGTMPAGFVADGKVLTTGAVELEAKAKEATFADARKVQQILIDTVGDRNVTVTTQFESTGTRVTITGKDSQRLSELTSLAEKLTVHAGQTRISLDSPVLLVRSGYKISENHDAKA